MTFENVGTMPATLLAAPIQRTLDENSPKHITFEHGVIGPLSGPSYRIGSHTATVPFSKVFNKNVLIGRLYFGEKIMWHANTDRRYSPFSPYSVFSTGVFPVIHYIKESDHKVEFLYSNPNLIDKILSVIAHETR